MLKVGTLVKEVDGRSRWSSGQLLMVAKRQVSRAFLLKPFEFEYFVVATDAPPGSGCWLRGSQIQALSALELLATSG